MNPRFILLLLLSIVFSLSAKAQNDCPPDHIEVVVNIKTNVFGYQNGYTLLSPSGDTLMGRAYMPFNNFLHSDTACISVGDTSCMKFIITDLFGDGFCCNGFFDGYFQIYINGELRVDRDGDIGEEEVIKLGCAQGQLCENPFPITEGIYETPVGFVNAWYLFQPDTSGIFSISTCFPENTCNTTLWGYEFCNPLNEFPDIQGASFYNDDDCGTQARTTVRMVKGEDYYLRIGSSTDDCRMESIKWQLEFLQAEIGCMDSLACNYSATATIDNGSCIYGNHPDCPSGPDLVVSREAFDASLVRDVVTLPDPCLRAEGCLLGYGERTVIRFDTEIENIGEKDFHIGAPPLDQNVESSQWEYDDCHDHWHYESYATYILFDENGIEVPVGFKNGFCVLDLECPDTVAGKYSCQVQGLTAGCKDIYDFNIQCQWIDITDVPDGKYTFATVVNWNHAPDATGAAEADYANNWAQVCIEIFRDSTGKPDFRKVDECDLYLDCLGIPNGTALPDCEGNCNGTAKKGDLVRDGNRDLEDVNEYIVQSLDNSNLASECTDLNLDGKINVADASLILECFLHEGNPPQPGHGHSPCEFTFPIINQFDSVWLKPVRVDLIDNFVDIAYLAPYGKLEAFEFEVEGIKISNVQSLMPNFNVSIYNNEKEILGLSFEEKSLENNFEFQPFIRVFFDERTADTICIGNVEALINEKLEIMHYAGGECLPIDFSNVEKISRNTFYSAVIPNPVSDVGQLIFENTAQLPVRIEFFSLSGKLLQAVDDFRGDSFTIEKTDFPDGILLYRITRADGVSSGKFF